MNAKPVLRQARAQYKDIRISHDYPLEQRVMRSNLRLIQQCLGDKDIELRGMKLVKVKKQDQERERGMVEQVGVKTTGVMEEIAPQVGDHEARIGNQQAQLPLTSKTRGKERLQEKPQLLVGEAEVAGISGVAEWIAHH